MNGVDIETSYLSLHEASDLLARRQVSSRELTEDALARIGRVEPSIRAFLYLTPEMALAQADRADTNLGNGTATPLTGIPMALKDIISVDGVRTTCGSKILENYVPQFTATAVECLLDAGAVLLGKTNMDEFAMGSSTENSAFGPVFNPWDLERVPGGSSGGSAAAVSAGEAFYALGTDTGGSIRQPAALTGTVGLKPTYGRVSRYGLVAFASSFDQIGPITRSVRDAAMVLGVIAGHDPGDSTSLDSPVPDYAAHLGTTISGLRLGVPREYLSGGMDSDVAQIFDESCETFRALGATLHEISLPHTDYALSTYYVISPAEAMANLARFDGVRQGLSCDAPDIWEMFTKTRQFGFGREVKRRILLGTYALSAGHYDAYYVKAQKVRTLVRRDFDLAFQEVDAILAPTTPSVAFRLGEKSSDPLQMYLSDVYTVPANIAGICGISIPAGFSEGLPVGIQVLGKPLDEECILRVANAFQEVTHFHQSHPPLGA